YEVILTAYNFRQRNSLGLKEAIANAARAGLGIVAMKTQAGVYWDKLRTQPINMKAALKWALQNENIHTSIPGFTTFDQLETDISVMEDLTLTSEEKADLKIDQTLALTGLYCEQCEQCIPQCQKNLNIPTLMRSFMYAYGYKNLSLAKETLQPIDLNHIPCTECNSCKVKCKNGFDIKNKILDISRIKDIPNEFLI
ncbi:MAG: 4Fe-4S dicluster domain-containing protein, partial [Candidatus Aminicenantes bacterium]|nr:4Fe-4S dicluster domain-containing protein [Candidatus Aminicenantes bacterium]